MKKVAIGFSLFALLGMGVSSTALADAAADKAEVKKAKEDADKKESLIVTDIKVGTGAEAVAEKRLTVHYTGWLYDPKAPDHKGKKIDSSHDHGKPYHFDLGRAQVIDGWDQGLVGMKVGGLRNLIVPSQLGYGAHGAGDAVPPNSKLVFDVELLKVE